jgi:hypothetical protein
VFSAKGCADDRKSYALTEHISAIGPIRATLYRGSRRETAITPHTPFEDEDEYDYEIG